MTLTLWRDIQTAPTSHPDVAKCYLHIMRRKERPVANPWRCYASLHF